ncbi:membrane-bound serine protease (ClpP class) [Belliella baltica DSM 15883]|uniref:Membrane-bound serine protease (ClpP class) n=1 Tax=Belliella baltica (strain DSM 15883 / CIP 108006 / LMG 21964 / BA134) TaxID=866536 RepID=I3Z5L5_BELBD|nr:NfeD family protein [Belliella baltica]AFL84533.1 membrane-bound serine protease (ClpP class) [Belliella baltica DSM 15883]
MKNILTLTFLLFFLVLNSAYSKQDSLQNVKKKVYTFEIKSDIDPRMNRKVKLALEEAESKEADLIIIEMDTYGGAVNDADDIRTMVLETQVPIHVWINKDAASAGALISIACDSIYMAPGSSIGAATVVMGGGGEAAPDKYQSYMRSMMRSTAEAKGRDPKIAEAMVDQNLEVEGISEKGSVITFSVSEAIANGFSEGEVISLTEVIEKQGIESFEIIKYTESNVEKVISIFLNPAVSGFLILIIFAGIYFEIQTPGVGFPIAASVIAIILYFIPYYLTGLAQNWEIAVFVVGVILLLIELFVIPGFGIFGILGIIGILTGLTLGMIPNDAFDFTFVPSGDLFVALLTVILAAIVAMALIFFFAPKINQWKAFSTIALATTQQRSEGYTSTSYQNDLLGKGGIAHTRLMPSGKILLEDEVYDAYSRGEFIDKGEKVIVISTEGTSLKVKKVSS